MVVSLSERRAVLMSTLAFLEVRQQPPAVAEAAPEVAPLRR
jgi:hypothetical protein